MGKKRFGQLGKGDIRPSSLLLNWTFLIIKLFLILSGGNHTIAVCDDGVYVWGHNYFRQLGKGDTENALSPVRLDFSMEKMFIRLVAEDGIQLLFEAMVLCLGWNKYDALNLEHNRQVSSPEKITGIDFDVENAYCGFILS